uniref:Uncharacterized protein n=1 Tax=Cucumis melo TaxID=3656 RepID=A0A9I9CKG3_CUCME
MNGEVRVAHADFTTRPCPLALVFLFDRNPNPNKSPPITKFGLIADYPFRFLNGEHVRAAIPCTRV